MTRGGSSGVPGGLAVPGDPSPGVCGEPGEREILRWGSVAEGAPGAWMEVTGTSTGGRVGDSGEPGGSVGESGARSSGGASGLPGAGAEGSAGWKGAPGAGQVGGLGEPGGPKAPSCRVESCGKKQQGVMSLRRHLQTSSTPKPAAQTSGGSLHPALLPSLHPGQEVPMLRARTRLLPRDSARAAPGAPALLPARPPTAPRAPGQMERRNEAGRSQNPQNSPLPCLWLASPCQGLTPC